MEIIYKNKQLMKICTDFSYAVKKHGTKIAEKIHMRIDEIGAAENVELMIKYKIGGCHQLKHNRKNQYAMHVVHPYRIVFEVDGDKVQVANIQEIVDYH